MSRCHSWNNCPIVLLQKNIQTTTSEVPPIHVAFPTVDWKLSDRGEVSFRSVAWGMKGENSPRRVFIHTAFPRAAVEEASHCEGTVRDRSSTPREKKSFVGQTSHHELDDDHHESSCALSPVSDRYHNCVPPFPSVPLCHCPTLPCPMGTQHWWRSQSHIFLSTSKACSTSHEWQLHWSGEQRVEFCQQQCSITYSYLAEWWWNCNFQWTSITTATTIEKIGIWGLLYWL